MSGSSTSGSSTSAPSKTAPSKSASQISDLSGSDSPTSDLPSSEPPSPEPPSSEWSTPETEPETTSGTETSSSQSTTVSNINPERLSTAQLLDRYNHLLNSSDLSEFKIKGFPSRDEFRMKSNKLLLKIHPDKVGTDREKLFKSVFPIREELLKRLKNKTPPESTAEV